MKDVSKPINATRDGFTVILQHILIVFMKHTIVDVHVSGSFSFWFTPLPFHYK